MAYATANTQIPQHVTALLSHLTSRPGVQSTFILSRKDGSIIQSTGLFASAPTRNSTTSATQTPPATDGANSTSTPPAESLDPSSPPGTNTVPAPTAQKPYQPSQAESLAARIFAFVSSASELGMSMSRPPAENRDSYQTGLNGSSELGDGAARDDARTEGVDREEDDEVKLLRLRTKKHEIVVVPDRKYLLCVVHDAAHAPGGSGAAGVLQSIALCNDCALGDLVPSVTDGAAGCYPSRRQAILMGFHQLINGHCVVILSVSSFIYPSPFRSAEMAAEFDIAQARTRFPALKLKRVFLDNAGGSQVLDTVIESITSYLSTTNVQLGATYGISRAATAAFAKGYEAAAEFINASPDEICLGISTTQLLHNLSTALRFQPGDELVLSKLNHEANSAPWVRVAERLGLQVKWWSASDSRNPVCDLDELGQLLSEKTRLVACPHASNITGTITNVREIAKLVHQYPRALLCVDGVALAPHRQVDVKDLDVDIYAFSWYKVYGPHIAQLYASSRVHDQIDTLGHFFKGTDTLDLKLNLASASYEATQCIPAVLEYLGPNPTATWDKIASYEEKLQAILLDYLRSEDQITICGEPSASKELRVPVVSFTVQGIKSRKVIEEVERRTWFCFRHGHMYSHRLLNDIVGLEDVEDGVVRISMLHYNTEEEITLLVESLKEVISSLSSISSTSTNPVDVIWENEGEYQVAGRTLTSATSSRGGVRVVLPKATDAAVAPELRRHPRRTNSCMAQSSGVSCARPPPCLLRQSDRKVNFVDNLVDTASQIVEIIWPLSAVASRSDSATGCKGVLPLRTFIQETLRRSRTSYSTLQVALYYLIKIKEHVPRCDSEQEQQPRNKPVCRAMQCGRRMFLAALILASKYLQDRNYSARAWSKISGLNTAEINQNELMFLEAVGWRLHVPEATFQRWTDIVLKFTPGAGGPFAGEGQCWRTVIPKLTPELDTVDVEPSTSSSMGGFESGLVSDSPSPRSPPTGEHPSPPSVYSQGLAYQRYSPLSTGASSLPSMPRPPMLPTPQLTPQTTIATTPAASASAFCARRASICAAMSQVQNMCMARSTLDQRPSLAFCPKANTFDGYPTVVRRSSLARSTSSASSPDSMISDVSTLSSSSLSSCSSGSAPVSSILGTCASAKPRLAVKATLRCTSNSLKECRKALAIASPIDEGSLGDVYSSPETYLGAVGQVPDLSNFSLGTPVDHEAAQSLCELSGAISRPAQTFEQGTTAQRQCRKRGRTGSEDLLWQNHVRHLMNLNARNEGKASDGSMGDMLSDSKHPQSLSAAQLSLLTVSAPLSGPAGMKRACCGSEARKIALNPSVRSEYMG
ncbi:uncharacterized protein CDV56_101201 [Aspergillus thermomutatus]|uniref:Roadblock/LAMTOR2 domain-containing protein n=1 Tax=Aspergillus thermomutatus TaxID=41047 RepID=A0A397GLM9_ASPTH|nr:uncharacterized protein CDV56_101201 [Aspergillus thermomutatus]RHZ50444.1 hypothetical protein CDV56_101201 [Aspergillus thermomutatus]